MGVSYCIVGSPDIGALDYRKDREFLGHQGIYPCADAGLVLVCLHSDPR